MPERPERFPRSERLTSSRAFREVYDNGEATRGRTHIVIVSHEAGARRRVGFVASRKVGDAVRRNRARRLMREAYRRLRSRFTPRGLESTFVFVARRPIVEAGAAAVREEMERLLLSSGLLESSGKGHADD